MINLCGPTLPLHAASLVGVMSVLLLQPVPGPADKKAAAAKIAKARARLQQARPLGRVAALRSVAVPIASTLTPPGPRRSAHCTTPSLPAGPWRRWLAARRCGGLPAGPSPSLPQRAVF